jgi:hypothetical protein
MNVFHPRQILFLLYLFTFFPRVIAQQPMIKNMEWGSQMKIHLELSNDSSYLLEADRLPHTSKTFGQRTDGYTYYPARLSDEFIDQLKDIRIEALDTLHDDSLRQVSDRTLWSALHHLIGGGYPHFMNTLLYALERRFLDLTAPLMKRPETSWKPDPLTKTYRRTRKWDYYIPVNQRHAHKEYKKRMLEGKLAGIKDIPEEFIRLFLETGNWKYKRMQKKGENKKLARIDMVKLLLGANYLGKPQIKYIKTMVLKAVNAYAKNQLPSVIIFENFNAAVAMSLDETGYRIDKIVFSDAHSISRKVKVERREKINAIIENINQVNKKLFQNKLNQYYSSKISDEKYWLGI